MLPWSFPPPMPMLQKHGPWSDLRLISSFFFRSVRCICEYSTYTANVLLVNTFFKTENIGLKKKTSSARRFAVEPKKIGTETSQTIGGIGILRGDHLVLGMLFFLACR